MATYVNDLRLTELATGEGSGTWGVTTNTNLELIGEALGYGTQDCFASDADATTTVADGATDPARAMYFKVTSSATLTATRTLTIAPNTMTRVMLIENATTGAQSIAISQGSGGNVTIANGAVKMVYLDGAGAGAAVVDALADLELGTITVANLTATTADINGGTIDGATIGGATPAAGSFTTVAADSATLESAAPYLVLSETDQTDLNAYIGNSAGKVSIRTISDDLGTLTKRLEVDHATGDISFYEDTGTTAKLFWDASTERLGLGTTSPSVALDVVGEISFGVTNKFTSSPNALAGQGANGALLRSAISSAANPSFSNSDDTNTGMFLPGSDVLGLSTAGVEAMRIDANGNVGIGTSSPATRLELSGVKDTSELRLSSTTNDALWVVGEYFGKLSFYSADSSGAGAGVKGSIVTAQSGSSGATPYMTFNVASTSANDVERMRIDADGDVGINTDSPGGKLSVRGTSGLGISDSHLAFGANQDAYITTGASGIVVFREHDGVSTNTERMRIDSNGNVGIGTTSPVTALDVRGEISVDYNATYGLRFYNQGRNNWSSIGNDDTSTGADLVFKDSTGEAMRITGGNVGIGTSSPSTTLAIGSNATGGYNGGVLLNRGASTYNFYEASDGTNSVIFGLDNSVSNAKIGTVNSYPVGFYTANSERMRIDSSGNVGIGNSSPSNYTGASANNLVVGSNSGNNGITVVAGTAGYSSLAFADSAGAGDTTDYRGLFQYYHNTDTLNIFTGGSNRVVIDSSGNTTIRAGKELRLNRPDDATYGAFSHGAAGTGIVYNDANGDGHHWQLGGAEKARIDSSGNLLVGTTSSGGAGGATINASGDTTDLTLYGTNTSFGGRIFFGDSSDRCSIQGKYGSGGGGQLEFYTDTAGGTNSLAMRIDNSQDLYLFNQSSGAGNADLRYSTSTGQVTYDTSSRLVKDQIQDIPYGLAEVLALSPKKYVRTDTDNQAEVGFIADEVVNIVPDVVGMMEKRFLTQVETDTEVVAGSVQYGKLTAVLVKAIQEQQEIINDLRARVAQLEGA